MKKFFFCVGEASGDAHAADLIHNLKETHPDFDFMGMGGLKMQQAGCKILVDNRNLAVVGVWEVLTHLTEILTAFKIIKTYLKTHRPDYVVLIDYPGLNLKIAKFAKKLGLKVIYYIPPQIWAWKKGRIKTIKKYVDHVFVIYPFEEKFYQTENIPVHYVKNPLLKKVISRLSKEEFCQKYSLNPNAPLIGLAPGSRLGEIRRMLDTILQSAQLIQTECPTVQLVLPLASSLTRADLQQTLDCYPMVNVQIISNDHQEVFHHCDAFLAVSGTVTVEIALAGTPVVVIYKVSPLTYWLGKMLIHVKYMSLTNLILDEPLLPELLQEQANPENISKTVFKLLNDQSAKEYILAGLAKFKNELTGTENHSVLEIAQAIEAHVI